MPVIKSYNSLLMKSNMDSEELEVPIDIKEEVLEDIIEIPVVEEVVEYQWVEVNNSKGGNKDLLSKQIVEEGNNEKWAMKPSDIVRSVNKQDFVQRLENSGKRPKFATEKDIKERSTSLTSVKDLSHCLAREIEEPLKRLEEVSVSDPVPSVPAEQILPEFTESPALEEGLGTSPYQFVETVVQEDESSLTNSTEFVESLEESSINNPTEFVVYVEEEDTESVMQTPGEFVESLGLERSTVNFTEFVDGQRQVVDCSGVHPVNTRRLREKFVDISVQQASSPYSKVLGQFCVDDGELTEQIMQKKSAALKTAVVRGSAKRKRNLKLQGPVKNAAQAAKEAKVAAVVKPCSVFLDPEVVPRYFSRCRLVSTRRNICMGGCPKSKQSQLQNKPLVLPRAVYKNRRRTKPSTKAKALPSSPTVAVHKNEAKSFKSPASLSASKTKIKRLPSPPSVTAPQTRSKRALFSPPVTVNKTKSKPLPPLLPVSRSKRKQDERKICQKIFTNEPPPKKLKITNDEVETPKKQNLLRRDHVERRSTKRNQLRLGEDFEKEDEKEGEVAYQRKQKMQEKELFSTLKVKLAFVSKRKQNKQICKEEQSINTRSSPAVHPSDMPMESNFSPAEAGVVPKRRKLTCTSGRLLRCKHCKKTYYVASSLYNHMSNTHGKNSKPMMCHVCSHVFKNKDSLSRHDRLYHSGHDVGMRHECTICCKSYSLKGGLASHNKVHHGGP